MLEDVGAVLFINEVGEMVLQCFFIAALFLILENFDDYRRIPVAVQVDLLMIGYFSDLAALIC